MNEGSVEENNPGPNKTSKTASSEHISSNRKTPSHLKDPTKQRNSKRGPSGKATSTENPNLEEPVLSIQTLSSKRRDTCLMICEEEREPTSSPHTSPTKICSQVGPEDPEHEKYEEINTLVDLDFDNVTQSADDFCKANENRIPERSQGVAEQLQQCHVELELHQQEPPLTVRILDSQEHTEKDFKSQQDLHSLGALGSDTNAGILDPEDTEAEAKALKSNAEAGDPLHTYQPISVVSHLGSSPDSGHYISDVYDFQKQAWFTFNDLQVSEIDESVMREARLRTGCIFFYMHRDIFQALLGKTRNSQLLKKTTLA
uniref:USP domain-containing protein n=2 Tax=Sus scrofa TaxID=9823 RepID=A0A8D0XF64_PIG